MNISHNCCIECVGIILFNGKVMANINKFDLSVTNSAFLARFIRILHVDITLTDLMKIDVSNSLCATALQLLLCTKRRQTIIVD